jgi:hypothetical protein
MTRTRQIFDVDKEGLAKLLTRRGREYVVLELVQNALDEDVTEVKVDLVRPPGSKAVTVRVEDDSLEGFRDLSHAWTLFADTYKRQDATKRGRFNLGEKLVISCCEWAEIVTTKGTVLFDEQGRHSSTERRKCGSVFRGAVKLTREEEGRAIDLVKSVLVHENVSLFLNGEQVPSRAPVGHSRPKLLTEVADEEGYLRRVRRHTDLDVYEPMTGETPTLFELGIPVCETGDRWHVSVGQKAPLNLERDGVPAPYLREVRALVLNLMAEQLTKSESTASWVGDALSDDKVEGEAVTEVITKRYGNKRVVADPSDPEGTKRAVMEGYSVIQAGSFSRDQWENIRKAEAAKPAGQVTPSPKAFGEFGEEGKPLKVLKEEEWTRDMEVMVACVQRIGSRLVDYYVRVRIAKDYGWPFGACYKDQREPRREGLVLPRPVGGSGPAAPDPRVRARARERPPEQRLPRGVLPPRGEADRAGTRRPEAVQEEAVMRTWKRMEAARLEPEPCRHCGQVEHERSCIEELKRIIGDHEKVRSTSREAIEDAGRRILRLQEDVVALSNRACAAEAEVQELKTKIKTAVSATLDEALNSDAGTYKL